MLKEAKDSYQTAVSNLQRYLRALALSEGLFPPPPVDGVFDTATEEALRNFQALYGLSPTGNADLQTWERLYEAYLSSVASSSTPQGVLLFPTHPRGYVFPPFAKGFAIAALQYMLRELKKDYELSFDEKIDGYLGKNTQDAVEEFQRLNGLPLTRGVDLLTWNRIADCYNLLFRLYQSE